MEIGCLIIGVLFILCSIYFFVKAANLKIEHDDKQQEIENRINLLIKSLDDIDNEYSQKLIELDNIKDKINLTKSALENQQELSKKAFENYCEVLDNLYSEEEKEYDQYKDAMETAYSNLQFKYMQEIAEEVEELDKIKATRIAALEAQRKEKEIKEKLSFYCLKLTPIELADIEQLELIKPKLNNPRILSMLIWSTYFQKPMTTLCNNVLGTSIVTGIYKITDQITGACYVGQSVDIATRWKSHAKCGLGIDTPQGNKLYKAMMEDGIWNFSWELLEACSKDQLDEKEKFYIDLYGAKDYGMNTTKGNQ